MSVLSSTKPGAWTLSPQMTAAPELWRGCVLYIPMWEGFGIQQDIANYANTSPTVGIPWSIGDRGYQADFNDSGYVDLGIDFSEIDLHDWTEMTVAARGVSPTLAGDADILIGERDSGANTGWSLGIVDGAGNDAEMRFTYNGVADYDTADVPDLRVTKKSLAWRIEESNSYDAFVEGELFDSIPIGNLSVAGDGPHNVLFGARNNSGSPVLIFREGQFDYFGVWNRLLANREIKKLHEDPFVMLRPAGF